MIANFDLEKERNQSFIEGGSDFPVLIHTIKKYTSCS